MGRTDVPPDNQIGKMNFTLENKGEIAVAQYLFRDKSGGKMPGKCYVPTKYRGVMSMDA